MRAFIRPAAAALSLACLTMLAAPYPVGVAIAQEKPPGEDAPKQIALTAKQVESVIAAKPAIDAIVEKLPQNADKPDPKIVAKLDALAKADGFASYEDYNDVDANVEMVMEGFDPQTKQYIGHEAVLKKEIAVAEADKKMPAKDKKEMLAQMNEELKSAATPLQFPANVQVVTKYYDKLAAMMSPNQ